MDQPFLLFQELAALVLQQAVEFVDSYVLIQPKGGVVVIEASHNIIQ